MANVFKNSQVVVNRMLMDYKNALGITRFVKQEYNDQFGKSGAKKGDSIELRDPVQLTVGDGDAITPQSIEEKTRFLLLNIHKHIAWEWTAKEETLDVDQWMKRYGTPSVKRLANEVDRLVMQLASRGAGLTKGTVATAVAAFRTFADCKAKIENRAAPGSDDMLMLVDPATQVDAVTLAQALFHSGTQIKEQYEDGNMGRHGGFNWHRTNNVYRHKVGPLGGTPLADGAQTGASILTKAWTSSASSRLLEGDVITFGSSSAGVFAVNPITKETLTDLFEAQISADVSSDGGGALTMSFVTPLIATGPYQNVSRAIADNDTIQIFGHASTHANKLTAMNIAMHPDAITVAMAPLYVPKGVDFGAMAHDEESGMAISFVRDFEIRTHKLITRIDVLAGAAVTHSDWICNLLAA